MAIILTVSMDIRCARVCLFSSDEKYIFRQILKVFNQLAEEQFTKLSYCCLKRPLKDRKTVILFISLNIVSFYISHSTFHL